MNSQTAAIVAEHQARPLPPPASDQGNAVSFIEREADREQAAVGGGEGSLF